MRVLVLGATGMLGHVASSVLAERHEVFSTCRRDYPADLASFVPRGRCYTHLAAGDMQRLTEIVDDCRPEAVLNCIGIVKQKPDAENAVTTIRVNSLFPHQVADACDAVGAKLIQVSTDCVFSGKDGGYTEQSVPDSIDLYGRSKLLGEVTRKPHLTIRTSIIGPQIGDQTGLFGWFASRRDTTVNGYVNAVFSGLTTYALSRVISTLLERTPELTGVYHVASKPLNKYELLSSIATNAGWSTKIVPLADFYCDRSLNGEQFVRMTGITIPSWTEMIAELTQLGVACGRRQSQAV